MNEFDETVTTDIDELDEINDVDEYTDNDEYDEYSETTTTGYGENIGNSLKGFFFGLLFIIGSIFLILWNEHRSINQTLALEELQSKIIPVNGTKYSEEYENKPILIKGEVLPKSILEDVEFGVKSNGLVLKRNVQMYQWEEKKETTSKNLPGGDTVHTTTYRYVKNWSSSPIDSSNFKHPRGHINPPMIYNSKTFATDAFIGDFYIPKSIIYKFKSNEDFNGLSMLPDEIKGFKNYKSFLYKGNDINSPSIGDIKISYTQAPKGDYSIIGMSKDKTIIPYHSTNGIDLIFIRKGFIPAEQIIKEEFDSNDLLTWTFRILALVFMYFGFSLLLAPIAALAKIIPFLGEIIGNATEILAGILTILVGSVVIAIAWFASRPILSLSIVGIGIILAILFGRLKKTTNE